MTELTAPEVARHLAATGLVPDDTAVVEPLGGGVSNGVFLATHGTTRVVVKQAMPALRVPGVWLAKVERTVNEGRAMRLVGRHTPRLVPEVLDLDEERCVIVVEAAPATWTSWKERLLPGTVDRQVAADLGIALGQWHTWLDRDTVVGAGLDDPEAFDQLRIDPYYRAAASAAPAYADVLGRHADELVAAPSALVHGDFSPKNVLVGPAGGPPWVIDFEVAHWGHPVFDVAFLLTHLVLKSVHRPEAAQRYAGAADAFLSGYRIAGGTVADDVRALLGHVGCLLVARVHGKSRAEYLGPQHDRTVLGLADRAIAGGVERTSDLCRAAATNRTAEGPTA